MKNWDWRVWTGFLRQTAVAYSFEYNDETSGYIKGGEYFHETRNSHLLKTSCVPFSVLIWCRSYSPCFLPDPDDGVLCYSEKLVSTYHIALCFNPDGNNKNILQSPLVCCRFVLAWPETSYRSEVLPLICLIFAYVY